MRLVPVIDLKDGQVVHARGGARDTYRPIRSMLSDSSAPLDVVAGLLGVQRFADLYLADLDAIEGRGGHEEVLEDLRRAFPALRLWVDNGLETAAACRAWLARGLGDLVVGSESLSDPALLGELREGIDAGRVVLSLDFKGDEFLGPTALLDNADSWPARVIVMTLARVGGTLGPDMEKLQRVRDRAPDRQVFAAGGVRGVGDLEVLVDAGARGALVASALHDGRITRAQLARFGAAHRP